MKLLVRSLYSVNHLKKDRPIKLCSSIQISKENKFIADEKKKELRGKIEEKKLPLHERRKERERRREREEKRKSA